MNAPTLMGEEEDECVTKSERPRQNGIAAAGSCTNVTQDK